MQTTVAKPPPGIEFVTCPFCGCPVERVIGQPGRPRMMHRDCVIATSLLQQLEAQMTRIRWRDTSRIAAVRRRMMRMLNYWFNQPKALNFSEQDWERNPE